MHISNTTPPAAVRPLTVPVPADCTECYADGWAYADWFLSKGGSLDADSPDGWPDEKYSGWWDRLAEEKRRSLAQLPG